MSWRKDLKNNSIEDFFFQYKIEFYFIELAPNLAFSRVAITTDKNTSFGVHGWNKIWFYIYFFFFLFSLRFYLQLLSFYLLFDTFDVEKLTFSLTILRQFGLVQRVPRLNIGYKCSFVPRKWRQIKQYNAINRHREIAAVYDSPTDVACRKRATSVQ